MKNIYSYLFLLYILFAANINASAQCNPVLKLDSSRLIFNAAIYSSAKVGNTLYVGGTFTRISRNTGGFVKAEGGYTGNPIGLASWPKTNGAVNAIVADGTGGWIIGGNFTQVGTVTRNRIAQINAAGQVTAWDPNANGQVSTVYRNGTTLYVGGQFTTIGGQSRNRIASYDLVTGFINAWDPNADGTVNTIAATATDVYVGGSFTNIGGQARNRIAAISTTTGLATSWNPNVSTGSIVYKILLGGTNVYFGGQFSVVGGQTRNNIAAVDATTGTPTSWNPSSNSTVLDMITYGSNIIVSGNFTTIGSQSRLGVAELDNVFGNATSRNFNMPTSTIYALKIIGNYIYMGGNFTITTTGQANLVKANLTTNTIDPWEANFNSTVYAIEPSGTDLYVAGNFTQHYNNRAYLAAIDVLTDELTSWAPSANGAVYAMAANTNNVYIGGTFTTVSGTTRNRIASISTNGTLDTWNPNASSTVYSLLMDGSNLYVGGAFTTISSTTRNRIARYDVTTGNLSTWNPSVNNGQVQTMTIAGSDIYVGGTFTAVSSPTTTRNRAASFVMSTASLTGWNPAPDGNVNTMLASGSNIYVGGGFSNIGGQFSPRLSAISQSTGLASTWSPYPNNEVYYIAIEGNTLFAAGAFQNIGGQSRNNIAAVDLTTGNATTWDPSSNGIVLYVAVHNDRLILGGSYNTISGQAGTPFATQYNLLSTAPVVNITGNNSVCAATPVTYTAITSVTGATYQWKKNGLNVGTGSTYVTIPVNNDQVQCVITTPIGSCYTAPTATSNTITVSVTAPVTPTISISGSNSVCQGSSATYTATTNITGGTLQWKVNGNNVGTNNTSFSYTPANGDVLTCMVATPSSGCFSPTSATSAPINIVVNTPAIPAVSISTPNTTICAGTSVTFTNTTNVAGGTYQWKIGTTVVGTNSTYTTSTLTNNANVTCTVTIPVGGCYTTSSVVSNVIVMTVNSNTTPSISISGNATPCGSASATTYTATTNVVGGTYQWRVNGLPVGTNSSTYAYIPAANDVLTCEITAAVGTCYLPTSVTSTGLNIVPVTPSVPTASVTGSNNLCSGQNGTYIASTNVLGATYQWKVNGVNAGTNSGLYTYAPVNGDVVTCVITTPSSACYTTPTVTSNSFTVTVNSPALPTINITTATTSVCSGIPVLFDGTNNNVPGGTYQWKVNGNNVLGGVNSTFVYIPSNGDIVTCAITVPVGGCYLVTTSFSNQLTMNVTQSITPTISVNASASSVCLGTVVNFTATSNISGPMQWKVNGVNVGTGGATYSYAPANGDAITCEVAIPTTGCYTLSGTLISTPASVLVNTPVTPNITVAADHDTTCEGSNITLTATTNISGGTYLWKINGFNAGTNSPTHSYVPQNNDIILCTIIAPPGCYTTSAATSTLKVLKVKTKQILSYALGAAPIVELGGTVFINTTIPAGITNYSIDWKKNGTTFATTTTNVASYIKTPGIDTLTAVLTTTDGCYAPSTSPEIYVYSVGTAVNDIVKTEGINVFPNPFSDRITVKGVSGTDKMILFDMAGRSINPASVKDNSGTTLIFSDIAPGAYILKVLSANGNIKANIPLRKM